MTNSLYGNGWLASAGDYVYWLNNDGFFDKDPNTPPLTIGRLNVVTGKADSDLLKSPTFLNGTFTEAGFATDGRYLYWTGGDAGGEWIARARIDGSDPQLHFLKASYEGQILRTDGRYLYWFSSTHSIARSNVDGTGVVTDYLDLGVDAFDFVITGAGAAPPPPAPQPSQYVALGDSYSSGEGNPPFYNSLCRRSTAAWPNKAATMSGATLIKNLACSGAKIAQLTHSWPARGQGPQIGMAAIEHPTVVTVTIGGNDLGFSSILSDCYSSVTPFAIGCDTDGAIAEARKYLSTLKERLIAVYREMKQRLTGARIVVVGYPRIFPTVKAHNCAWLSDSERKALNSIAGDLDDTVAGAAAAAGVSYVSALDVLAGHELCTANSWVNPIEPSCGLPGHTNCGHPNGAGQAAIAKRAKSTLVPAAG